MRAALLRQTGDEKVDLIENAELIDVPIANEHLDRGNHCLIAVASLGVA